MAEPEPAPAGLADAVLLAPLTEDSFLHNLHVRYKRDIIYTYVGNALVSVNPCRALPLYSAELVRTYLARPPYLLPPHLYAITATAYRWVRDRNENQCIVITGESGAGKTEAARVCLQCAVVAGGGGGGALAAAGTLLEAFGNAATARNHNASRFGKLLDIEFDFKGEPVGGHITHYLLEKERVCRAAEGERNFHVLYQLLAGADAHLLKRLKLQRSWEQYRVLRGGAGCAEGAAGGACAECAGAAAGAASASPRRAPQPPGPRAPHADRDHFAFTKAAMGALGFSAGQCGAVLRLLAFLLKLGNVQFEPQHNIDGSIGTRLQHEYELREACALVGVEADALVLALGAAPPLAPQDDASHEEACSAEEECSSEAGSEAEGAGAEWARALRDRLLCALYSRLFTWLVNAVNDAIKPAAVGARRSLGILDVYGLESLAHNGLERLLINYAAERVQAAVTAATLRREQEEYAREGLAWTPLPYADHELYADLLDAGAESVLGALRDCSTRGASDSVFLQRLQRRRHPRLLILPPDRFQVVHFGGAVAYSARGIVQKNRDALCRRCAAVLAAAREPLLAALFAPGSAAFAGSAGSPRRPCALACRQRALVGALVRRLPPAPRLVRCLRADAALRPHRFDAALLRHQIRTQGIMDMALLRRAGWCESMCARGVVARYGVLRARAAPGCAPASPVERDEPVRAARALLRSLPIPSAEFAYGRTKVFIRSPRTVWELEALRAARVQQLVRAAQRAWRRHRARVRHRAALRIARAWRRHREKRIAVEKRAARHVLRRVARSKNNVFRCAAARERRGGGRGGGRGGRRGARHLARLVRARAARLPARAVGAAAGAPPLARLRRLAAVPAAAPAGARRRAAAPPAPPLALPPLPPRLRPDGPQPHAREGHRERAVQGPQAQLRAERRPPVRRRLRAAARLGRLAPRAGRRRRRPLRGVRGRGGQGGALQRPRVALPGRRVHGRAAAAGGALAAPQAPRARALRLPPVAVALRRRPARGARARVRRPGELDGGAVAVLVARAAGRAGLPVRRRGRMAAARRRAGAHVPRAGAGHQAVPRGAERRGRAAARQRGHRVRGQLRAADGDGVVPRGGRRGGRRRRAPAAARQPHGRAAVRARAPPQYKLFAFI